MSPYLLCFAIGEFDSSTLWNNAVQYKIYLVRNTTTEYSRAKTANQITKIIGGEFAKNNFGAGKDVQFSALSTFANHAAVGAKISNSNLSIRHDAPTSAQFTNRTHIGVESFTNNPQSSGEPMVGEHTSASNTNVQPTYHNEQYNGNTISAVSANLNFSGGFDSFDSGYIPDGFASYLNTSVRLVQYLERQLGVDYKLPKLDLLFLPGFGYEALENWGLISIK